MKSYHSKTIFWLINLFIGATVTYSSIVRTGNCSHPLPLVVFPAEGPSLCVGLDRKGQCSSTLDLRQSRSGSVSCRLTVGGKNKCWSVVLPPASFVLHLLPAFDTAFSLFGFYEPEELADFRRGSASAL